jgi:hypothetical protein
MPSRATCRNPNQPKQPEHRDQRPGPGWLLREIPPATRISCWRRISRSDVGASDIAVEYYLPMVRGSEKAANQQRLRSR